MTKEKPNQSFKKVSDSIDDHNYEQKPCIY